MDEEAARLALQDIFSTDEEVELHIQRIRMLSKGYWSVVDAKAYIENLKLPYKTPFDAPLP